MRFNESSHVSTIAFGVASDKCLPKAKDLVPGTWYEILDTKTRESYWKKQHEEHDAAKPVFVAVVAFVPLTT